MATIYIADLSPELASLVVRVHRGEEFSIENGSEALAVLKAPACYEKPRLASAILAGLERRESPSTLPAGFASDMEDGVRARQHETLLNPWE